MLKKLQNHLILPTYKEITSAFKSDEEWRRFCFDRENPVFEFLNKEFISTFSTYLSQQIKKLEHKNLPIIILEIGAGNGRLSYFLRQKIEDKSLKIIATDNGKWNLKTIFPVETIDYKLALKKYNPEIVICSWMPFKIDFTKEIRKTKSVKEYILVGETDGGCCGDEQLTWEQPQNFKRINLDYISEHQICRADYLGEYYHSKTTSFRRT